MYHNTTSVAGRQLALYESTAQRQEDQVYEFFKFFKSMSASQVWQHWRGDDRKQVPITSIRRAISNLYKNGLLVKTDLKISGLYDRPEHIYRINQ